VKKPRAREPRGFDFYWEFNTRTLRGVLRAASTRDKTVLLKWKINSGLIAKIFLAFYWFLIFFFFIFDCFNSFNKSHLRGSLGLDHRGFDFYRELNNQTLRGVLREVAARDQIVLLWAEKWFYAHIAGFRLQDCNRLVLDEPIAGNQHQLKLILFLVCAK